MQPCGACALKDPCSHAVPALSRFMVTPVPSIFPCCRQDWVPLADAAEVFCFDFADSEQNMQPAELTLDFTITQVSALV